MHISTSYSYPFFPTTKLVIHDLFAWLEIPLAFSDMEVFLSRLLVRGHGTQPVSSLVRDVVPCGAHRWVMGPGNRWFVWVGEMDSPKITWALNLQPIPPSNVNLPWKEGFEKSLLKGNPMVKKSPDHEAWLLWGCNPSTSTCYWNDERLMHLFGDGVVCDRSPKLKLAKVWPKKTVPLQGGVFAEGRIFESFFRRNSTGCTSMIQTNIYRLFQTFFGK